MHYANVDEMVTAEWSMAILRNLNWNNWIRYLKDKYLISLQTKYSNQIVNPTKQVLVSKSKVKEKLSCKGTD